MMGCCQASMGTESRASCSRSPSRRYLVDIIENEMENIALSAVRQGFREQVNVKDSRGQTPLCAAIEHPIYSLRLIEELVVAGAKVNKAGYDGVPPVYRALEKLRFDVVELLLRYNAQIPYKIHSKAYEVMKRHNAALQASSSTLKMMLEAGLDPNYVEPVCKQTLFMQAVTIGSEAICKVLLDSGADPCLRDSHGLTCLHKAVQHHSVHALKLLLELDTINVDDSSNINHLSPLHMLRCNHHAEDLHSRCACYDIMVALLEAGAAVNNANDLLTMAVMKNRLAMVEYLMDRCPDGQRESWLTSILNASTTEPLMLDYILDLVLGEPPNPCHRHRVMEMAVLMGHVSAVKKMFTIDPEWNTSYWQTDILLLAVARNSYDICHLLLQHGADPNKLGLSLEKSCWHENCLGDPSLVKLLLCYGADVNRTRHNHFMPLQCLVEKYPHNDSLLDPAVRMFVCNGIDRRKHYWLLDRLMPGVPFGQAHLRAWLIERLVQPAPLFHQCIQFFRLRFRHRLHKVVPLLPIPPLIKDRLLLRDIFQE